jgi:hypothetical protein
MSDGKLSSAIDDRAEIDALARSGMH